MADEEKVKMDAIIVGGGPAGCAAAYVLAKAGLQTLVVERGEYAGSKNMGGLLYGTVLNQLIPNFYEKAPIERPVSKRRLIYLGEGKHSSIEFGSDIWSKPPYNNTFVVYRTQFDRWFAKQAEEAGANLIEGMVVEELLYEGTGPAKKAVGVKIRGDEKFYADVIILADGANCLVTESAQRALGMKSGIKPQDYAVGVKEIISLPREKIQDRFGIGDDEGVAIDMFGLPFKGLIGGAFIYTAKEALHLGVVAKIETLVHENINPNEVMDKVKEHPLVAKLVAGGELLEYSAHMLPEGGYYAVPELTANGVIITGDAAGLLNMSLYKEGTNLAMQSGIFAAETAIAAKQKGDFTKSALAVYEEKLKDSFVIKDLKKYRDLPYLMEETPHLFSLYPDKATQLMCDFFTVTPEPKADLQKKAVKRFLADLPKFQFVRDTIRARKFI